GVTRVQDDLAADFTLLDVLRADHSDVEHDEPGAFVDMDVPVYDLALGGKAVIYGHDLVAIPEIVVIRLDRGLHGVRAGPEVAAANGLDRLSHVGFRHLHRWRRDQDVDALALDTGKYIDRHDAPRVFRVRRPVRRDGQVGGDDRTRVVVPA